MAIGIVPTWTNPNASPFNWTQSHRSSQFKLRPIIYNLSQHICATPTSLSVYRTAARTDIATFGKREVRENSCDAHGSRTYSLKPIMNLLKEYIYIDPVLTTQIHIHTIKYIDPLSSFPMARTTATHLIASVNANMESVCPIQKENPQCGPF